MWTYVNNIENKLTKIVAILTAMFSLYTGLGYIVSSYADATFDTMLLERGISKESFLALQQKLSTVEKQTNNVQTDVDEIHANILTIIQNNVAAEKDRTEIKGQVNKIYDYLIQGGRNAP